MTRYQLLIYGAYDNLKQFPFVMKEKVGGKWRMYAEYPKLANSLEEAAEIKDRLRKEGHRAIKITEYG